VYRHPAVTWAVQEREVLNGEGDAVDVNFLRLFRERKLQERKNKQIINE
jgi:hypothetical protein